MLPSVLQGASPGFVFGGLGILGSQESDDLFQLQGVVHPGRLTWNIQIIHLERKMIFQTSMIMFHVNLQGVVFQISNGGYFSGRNKNKMIFFFKNDI